MPIVAFAATKTWDGGGANNLWSTAANWDSDTRPGTGDTILFDGTGKKNALIGDTTFLYSIGEIRMTTANTGTLTIGKPIAITKNLSISGGTLAIQGGSQITNKGGWINGGATFTAGTGSVVLAGTGSSHSLKETSNFKNLRVNNGLVRYWRFDEGPGATSVRDEIGTKHLSFVNFNTTNGWSESTPSPISFLNPYALALDGSVSGARAQVADAFATNPAVLTFSVWVYPQEDSCHIVFDYGNSAAIRLGLFGNGFDASITASDASSLTYPVTLNSWSHVAMTYDRQFFRLYVNGVQVASDAATAAVNYGMSDPTMVFGSTVSPGYCPFKGRIDDARLYERALTASDIASLYAGNAYTGSETYTLNAALTVNGDLRIETSTLDVSSSNYAITASGAFVNNSRFVPRSGTVTLNGIGSNLKMFGSSLYNLTIAAAKSAVLRAAATVTNVLTIASSAALHLNGNALTATDATITNNGTLTEGTGAVLHNSTFTVPTSAEFGAVIAVSLADDDENIDGTSADTVTVTVGGETVTLTETAVASGVFNGVIRTEHSAVTQGDGIINRGSECALNVSAVHADEQDSTDATTSVVALSYTSDECGTSSSGGGGSGGGGGRGSNTKPTPARTTSPSQMQATPRQTSGVSSRLAAIQKRVDQMQKKIAVAKNPLQKKALQRSLDRLQKTLKRVTK